MTRQVLGKRSHSSFSSPSPSRSPTPVSKSRRASVAFEPPSPDPTPKLKRVKTCVAEVEEEGSNKENIPPEPVPVFLVASGSAASSSPDSSSSTITMTPREMRASRRASTQSVLSTPTSRRISPPKSRSTASSSNRPSDSPPISRKATQLRTGTETPSKTMARLSLSKPPSTPTCLPPSPPATESHAKKSLPAHMMARALLRPQAHDDSPLVGREQERTQILEFLAPFLAGKSHANDCTSLYVSGAPGTGKTALVNEVLKSMSSSAASRDSDAMDVDDATLRVVYVNCMSLGSKDGMGEVWERCITEFGAVEKKRGAAAKMDWSERFGNLLRERKCILVLDEIDHLAASTSASQIFALASTPQTHASLRIIGISNTHTLTHTKTSTHTQTIHFEPYTAGQMKTVLTTRLGSLPAESVKLFSIPTIALLTMKIASQTGDIRTVFSVARRALDLAVAALASSGAAITVTPAHVLAALKASNACSGASQGKSGGAEIVTRVRNLGLHARFALATLLLATKRVTAGLALSGSASNTSSGKLKENASFSSAQGRDTAAPSIDVTTLHGFYAVILGRADSPFHSVGRTEFGDLVNLLEGSGLVELSHGRGFGNKGKGAMKSKGTLVACVARGMREEELVRGLVGSADGTEGELVNVREEEVKHIWEREIGRIDREVKVKFGDAPKKADFDGAEED